jgi:CRISPR/Cas system endoribonuclease Cas6 (RAMP superfamily)
MRGAGATFVRMPFVRNIFSSTLLLFADRHQNAIDGNRILARKSEVIRRIHEETFTSDKMG